ncbi:hypothetical protein [Sphingomonas turrisvirgatae]|uniref:Uncharacterized protein n=1 Tax=Sphingomonas turrisvirgatae TaxID=1888892 RepID=A0A1E3LY87_9SPHN|nr:hypothetical protein [Sphingomonas turrisvirgatae]ODP38055.1 hypothetical protein BFL28_15625 [Sphingomonas turrisvirgatae]
MVAYSLVQRLTPNTALIGAGVFGTLAALVAALLPSGWLEPLILGSGIAAFIPAAEPPLGFTARLCLGVGAGCGTALLAGFALSTLADFIRRGTPAIERVPSVRRADAHPDAPPREPLRAVRDLGFDMPDESQPGRFDLAEHLLPPEPVIAMGAPAPACEPAPFVHEPATAHPSRSPARAAAASYTHLTLPILYTDQRYMSGLSYKKENDEEYRVVELCVFVELKQLRCY